MNLSTYSFKKTSIISQLYYPIVSIAAALLLSGIIIFAMGFDPLLAYKSLVSGSLGSTNAISETLVKANPLIFTGLSYAIAKRCGIINLGADGQLYMGALLATIVGTNFNGMPAPIHILFTLAAGFIGGATFGVLIAGLKIRFGASELITTIMLNYVAVNIVSYFVTGPLKDVGSNFPQSAPILMSAQIPGILGGTRLHAGLLIALLSILFYYFFLWHTTNGYEMRVVGLNPSAGEYAGMNLNKNTIFSMLLAGGFAGLGGAIEIMAVQQRLMQNFSANYGFDGIAVALLGNNSPFGIAVSGILFGMLRSGSNKMQMLAGVPSAVIYMIQGLIILFIVGREFFKWKRKSATKNKVKKDNHEVHI